MNGERKEASARNQWEDAHPDHDVVKVIRVISGVKDHDDHALAFVIRVITSSI